MSLKNFLNRALRRKGETKDEDRPDSQTNSPWERLTQETESGSPERQGLARFVNVPTPGENLLRQAKSLEDELRKRASVEAGYDALLTRHRDLIDRFLEIAERKVSILDDYGDENEDALPEEVHKCLVKIAKRDPSIDISRVSPRAPILSGLKKLLGGYKAPVARYLSTSLESRFRAHHEARKRLPSSTQDISALAGVDFETYLAKLLREAGFESVVGTPATGDQGADLIARKNGKTIAIQAKGYRGSVGNAAVQEIVGALKFYRADEGWVVTNSTFTASARALAQANNIRLIDGSDLKDPVVLRAKP